LFLFFQLVSSPPSTYCLFKSAFYAARFI
jgi:hypothetical protein